MQFFSVYCEEDRYRGQWHVWFVEQVVAVGWAPRWFSHEGKTKDRGWTTARNVISTIEVGDRAVARLPDNRIGRIGEVTGLAIDDQSWSPTHLMTGLGPMFFSRITMAQQWLSNASRQYLQLSTSAATWKKPRRSGAGGYEAFSFMRDRASCRTMYDENANVLPLSS